MISARTLHENFDQSGVPYLETLPEAGRRLADRMTGHARALTARVAAEGALLSVERGGTGPVLLGWLLALADCGFAPVDYAPLAVRECGRPASFQALVLRRGAADAETALVYFCRLAAPAEPAGRLTGTAAAAYLHLWSGACAYRFAVCSPDGAPMGRGGVWRHKTAGRVLAIQATPAGTAQQVRTAAARLRPAGGSGGLLRAGSVPALRDLTGVLCASRGKKTCERETVRRRPAAAV